MKKVVRYLWLFLAILVFLPAARAQESESLQYRVGIDDVLDINILQPTAMVNSVTVSPSGSISFPYIGDVIVKELTLSEIKREVETRLADGYMKYPLVTVILRESRSRKFLVYGDVTKPGMYLLQGEISLLKGITLAGGFSKNSVSPQVRVLRPNKNGAGYQIFDIDIRNVMKGMAGTDMNILSGDTIVVSEGKFFVYGEVDKPGIYPMEVETSVLRAISIAGGLKKNSSSVKVKILRPGKDGTAQETIAVDLKSAMQGTPEADLALLSGDTIVVTEEQFFVYGDVNKPGVFPIDGDTSLLKAVSLAGGFLKNGAYTQIKVMRAKEGEAKGSKAIDIDVPALMAGNESADLTLQAGDTVMVSQGKFYAYGEVNSPGMFPLEENTTVLKAIAMAGGFTKFGSSSRVKVLRAYSDGSGYENIKINIKAIMEGSGEDDILLMPSDTVVVFEGVF